jgi:hypothetical protein
MRRVLMAGGSGGGNGVPVRNGLVAEYKFDECRNLAKYSEWFNKDDWIAVNVTITPNASVAPDGTTTADYLYATVNDANLKQVIPSTPYKAYVFSFYYKGSGSNVSAGIWDNTNNAWIVFQALPYVADWTRYSIFFVVPWNCTSIQIEPWYSYGTRAMYIWGAQLEEVTQTTKNLLYTIPAYSNDFSAWSKSAEATVTANAGVAPDGTMTATYISLPTSDKNVQTGLTVTPDTDYIYSIYFKATGVGAIIQRFVFDVNNSDAVDGSWYVTTLTNEWVRYSVKFKTKPNCNNICIYAGYNSRASQSEFYAWGAQLEQITPTNKTDANVATGTDTLSDTTGFIPGYNVTISSSTTYAHQGSRSLKAIYGGVGAGESCWAQSIPVTPGVRCIGSVWMRGAVGGETVFLDINNKDSGGGWLDEVTGSSITLTTTWTKYSLYKTANANAATANLMVFASSVSEKTIYIDEWKLEEYPDASSYEEYPHVDAAKAYVSTTDKQYLMDYSKPMKNLIPPSAANCGDDGFVAWYGSYGNEAVTIAGSPYQGTGCIKCMPNVGSGMGGIFCGRKIPVKENTTYTLTLYAKLVNVAYSAYSVIEQYKGATKMSNAGNEFVIYGTEWARYTQTFTTSALCDNVALTVFQESTYGFYIDCVQLEEGGIATSYEEPPKSGLIGSTVSPDTNDPTWCKEGASFITDDRIECPVSLIDALVSAFTIIVVAKKTDTGTLHDIFGGGYLYSSQKGISLRFSASNVISIVVGNGTTIDVGNTPTVYPDTWYYIVATYDGHYAYPYANGQNTDRGVVTSPIVFDTGRTPRFGYAEGEYLRGSIAYSAIYNRKLSTSEIAKNYNFLKSYLLRNRGIVLP